MDFTVKEKRAYTAQAKKEIRPMVELVGLFLARCRAEEDEGLFDDQGQLTSQDWLHRSWEHERRDKEMHATIARLLFERLTTRRGIVA